MIINFYSTLRDIAGTQSITLDYPNGETISHIIQKIVALYPDMHYELLDDNNMIYGHVHIFVNGLNMTLIKKNSSETISNQSTLDIFHAIGGGHHTVAIHLIKKRLAFDLF